jgi:hypothetical protein
MASANFPPPLFLAGPLTVERLLDFEDEAFLAGDFRFAMVLLTGR